MSLVRYDSVDVFLRAAGPLVATSCARVAGLRSWVDGVAASRDIERVFMATWHGLAGTGIAYQRDDSPLTVHDSADDACAAFATALAREHPALDGVVGDLRACEAFAARWRQCVGGTHRLRFRMRNHVLGTLDAPPPVGGRMRVASRDDRDWLLEMQRAFADEARLPLAPRDAQRMIDTRLQAGTFRIWNDGDDVALAGFASAGADAARIAPVYTLPRFRARGYGSAIVAAICEELVHDRRHVFLVTDLANRTSNALYARLGFVPLDDFFIFDLVAERR